MQQQQQGGGSQHGASPREITPFAAAIDPRSSQILGGDLTQQQQQLDLGDTSLASVAEAASPISYRPPTIAHSSAAAGGGGNFEKFLPVGTVSGLADEDALALVGGGEADRGGGVGGGNRWPRQETLALLKIRSDMDAAFRDATLKGPLWEDVSRKLAELGYRRSAKKCKEKFENVHKYYKRTKEGRAGRQDGKSYKFFSQLEALHSTVASATSAGNVSMAPSVTTGTTISSHNNNTAATPVSIALDISNPMPMAPMSVSSVRIPHPDPISASSMPLQAPPPPPPGIGIFPVPADHLGAGTAPVTALPTELAPPPPSTSAGAPIGISFSSDESGSSASSSSSSGTDDEEMDDQENIDARVGDLEGEPDNTRKRKRREFKHGGSSSDRMMEFFEGLMKEVMQKQEAMQQRFLEAIEKREQDRMIREEAWKRQEMARLAREHDLLAQERSISASRDAAIVAFLQKITGQTIQLPSTVTVPAAPPLPQPSAPALSPPSPPPQPPPSSLQQQYQRPPQQQQQSRHCQPPPPPPPPPQQQQHHHQLQQQPPKSSEAEVVKHQRPIFSEVVNAIPEQQVPPQEFISGAGSIEAASSRWPKVEVLALIELRSRLESRYQEAGPKGPLWEEISTGMQQMGYKRSAKRCKEKWENINKYYKKVKESNKKRPEDAKTCPYYHQLDALYRKKMLGNTTGGLDVGVGVGGSSSSVGVSQIMAEQQQQDPVAVSLPQMTQTYDQSDNKKGSGADLQTSNGDGMTVTIFGEGNQAGGGGAAKKPEDIVKEQHQQQQNQWQKHQHHLMLNGYGQTEEPAGDNINLEEDEDGVDEYEDDDEEAEEEMKMAYEIQFQRHNTGSSNGGGNRAPSFMAIVQ